MAELDDKKVVNIGWLKEQGYVIKEAYTDNTWCPTYNNITAGTIGDNIGVNTTCYGTGLEYAVTQLVCVKDVYPSGECTCPNVYGTATVTQTTGGLTTIPATGGTFYFSSSLVPYSAYTSTPIAGGCSPCTYSSSAYTSFTTSAIAIPANTSTSIKPIEGTDNHIHYVINQAAHVECSCDIQYGTATVTQTDSGLSVIPASGGSYTFSSDEVPYSAFTSTPTAEGCSPCVYSSSAYTSFVTDTIVIPANETSEVIPIENTNNHIHYVINQEARACVCDDLIFDPAELTWDYDSTETKEIHITFPSCALDNSLIIAGYSGYFSLNYDGNSTISIHPLTPNRGEEDRVFSYSASWMITNGSETRPCARHIDVTQYSSGCTPTTCTCYKVGSATASTVAATATSATVTWPYSAITATRDANCHWTSGTPTTGTASKTVYFDANTSCSDVTRSGSFSWTNHSGCSNRGCSSSDVTVSWSLTQGGVVASCSSLAVTAGGPGAAEGGNGLTLGSYTGNCFTNVQVSKNVDWITSIGLSNKTITGNVSPNSSASERNAVIKVTANECSTGKAFTYIQNGDTSTCPANCTTSFTDSVDYATTATTMGAFYKDNPEFTAVGLVAGDNITGIDWSVDWSTTGWKTIRVTMTQNTGSSSRICRFSVTATTATKTCTYNYRFTQTGYQGSCPDSFTSETISLVASTLPAEADSSKLLGYATLTDEYTAYTFSSSNTSMINNIGLGANVGPTTYFITGTVYENTSSYGRSSTITVNAKGPNLPSTGCNDTFTLGQDAATPQGSCPVSGSIINPQVVAAEGGTQVPIMHVLKNSTYTGYTITPTSSSSSYVSNVNQGAHLYNNWYVILADVTSNESSNFRRTLSFDVKMSGTTTPSSGCTYSGITVTQEGSCATIEQSLYLGRMSNNKISGDSQTSVGIAYVNPTSPYASWTAAFSTGTGNFVRNLTITNEPGGPGGSKKVTVDIDENNTGADRTFGVVFTGTKTDGGTCSKTLEFTQAAAASSCADLEITASSVIFNSSGGSISVGTISGNHTVTKTSDSPSWVTVNTSNGNVSLSVNATTVSRNGTVKFKVDDDTCDGKEVTVSQTVPVSIITYYSPSKLNVNLSNFTPAATAETFSNGVGKVEFAEVVTAIGQKAFSGKTSMTGIDIPNSVTSIGNSAFTNCTSLTSVTIPNSVTYINNYLLYNCTSLSSVTLESETLQLKPYSISNCPNLRKIEMTSVTACPSDYQNALENSADCPIYVPEEHLSDFWNSSTFQYKDRVIAHVGNQSIVYKAPQKLTGDSLKNAYSSEYASSSTKLGILLHTFNSSTKIGKITYDGVVRSFHDGAFDTRAIDYIVLPGNIKRIGQTVFQSTNLISIYFPDSLVGLCNSATDWGCDILHNCTKLKMVVAGSGLTQIGYGCFSCADEASSLTGITFYSTTPPRLDHGNTFGHTIHASIYVPCGQVSTYKSANIWNDSDIKGKIKAIPPCTS